MIQLNEKVPPFDGWPDNAAIPGREAAAPDEALNETKCQRDIVSAQTNEPFQPPVHWPRIFPPI